MLLNEGHVVMSSELREDFAHSDRTNACWRRGGACWTALLLSCVGDGNERWRLLADGHKDRREESLLGCAAKDPVADVLHEHADASFDLLVVRLSEKLQMRACPSRRTRRAAVVHTLLQQTEDSGGIECHFLQSCVGRQSDHLLSRLGVKSNELSDGLRIDGG